MNQAIVAVCEVGHLGLSGVEELSIKELLDYHNVLADRQEKLDQKLREGRAGSPPTWKGTPGRR